MERYIYVAYPLVAPFKISEDCESFTSLAACKKWVLNQRIAYVISIERADKEVFNEVKKYQPKEVE